MKIEQIYTACLAQGAYFIESNGEAAVIDPLRDTDAYIAMANAAGATIKYIFETHFHADFVSGHLELAEQTGATIVYGPGALTGFKSYRGTDGELFQIGTIRLKLLHTPGHTLESCCYLLENEHGKAVSLFSGDTLFIGDVGRPDLAQEHIEGLTTQDLAGMLYDSLRKKILPLPNDILVYPAHGAGSACGKNLSKETSDTLGNQKKTNYALLPDLKKQQFITELTTGLLPPPPYFPMNVRLNSQGYKRSAEMMQQATRMLSPDDFEIKAKQTHRLILDTRNAVDFAAGHISGAVNIGLKGSFAPWVGALIPFEGTGLLIVGDEGKEEEIVIRLARIGFDLIDGYLEGGIQAWKSAGKPLQTVRNISAVDFMATPANDRCRVLDVRTQAEFAQGHVDGAINLPLDRINSDSYPDMRNQTFYVYCAGGYRSMIYISILKAKMNLDLVNIDGGYGKLKESGMA